MHKRHVVIRHFSGANIEHMKYYLKTTQEKQPSQIIIHAGINNLTGN